MVPWKHWIHSWQPGHGRGKTSGAVRRPAKRARLCCSPEAYSRGRGKGERAEERENSLLSSLDLAATGLCVACERDFCSGQAWGSRRPWPGGEGPAQGPGLRTLPLWTRPGASFLLHLKMTLAPNGSLVRTRPPCLPAATGGKWN